MKNVNIRNARSVNARSKYKLSCYQKTICSGSDRDCFLIMCKSDISITSLYNFYSPWFGIKVQNFSVPQFFILHDHTCHTVWRKVIILSMPFYFRKYSTSGIYYIYIYLKLLELSIMKLYAKYQLNFIICCNGTTLLLARVRHQ
jgi:hypothetical protein